MSRQKLIRHDAPSWELLHAEARDRNRQFGVPAFRRAGSLHIPFRRPLDALAQALLVSRAVRIHGEKEEILLPRRERDPHLHVLLAPDAFQRLLEQRHLRDGRLVAFEADVKVLVVAADAHAGRARGDSVGHVGLDGVRDAVGPALLGQCPVQFRRLHDRGDGDSALRGRDTGEFAVEDERRGALRRSGRGSAQDRGRRASAAQIRTVALRRPMRARLVSTIRMAGRSFCKHIN